MQLDLLESKSLAEEHWRGMPNWEVSDDWVSWHSVNFSVRNLEDLQELSRRALDVGIISSPLTEKTQRVWFPPKARRKILGFQRYAAESDIPPRYPIYIVSKGRWESRLTAKALDSMKVPYNIVIEPTEFDNYASVIDSKKILVLPFSDLGQGSIPARNWIWNHSKERGDKRHWILDDNIRCFYRMQQSKLIPLSCGNGFRAAEDFTDRYENVGLSGFQYRAFARGGRDQPFVLNTRVYSCILIQNDLPFEWRGKYNEDTDLSLRVLKAGYCTILFYAFIMEKVRTLTMKGGNKDQLYEDGKLGEEGRKVMAYSLQEQHPDVTQVKWKWDRWQHTVDYSHFKNHNKLILRKDLAISDDADEYGLRFEESATGLN